MAFDSALQYLDELKDKYMHEVEKAIDDWDYQDFSPDKRTPLLENEISGDAATDVEPESNALQTIKDASKLDWSGLSRDEMLANQTFGRASIHGTIVASFEARAVVMATPTGGVQGLPDADVLQRFLHHAVEMNPMALAEAFGQRLQHTMWQIRAKALVLMEMVLESPDLVKLHLSAVRANAALLQRIDAIRTQDRSTIARENARKVLSLIRSDGANTMLVAREHIPAKPHVRHSPTAKKAPKPKPVLKIETPTPKMPTPETHHFQATSPKIAAAALASYRRRSQMEMVKQVEKPTMVTIAPPPAPSSLSRANSSTLQKMGSSRSGFAFVDQPSSQPRVSITMSRGPSFRS